MTSRERTITILRWVLPLVVVAAAGAVMAWMIESRQLPQANAGTPPPRSVRVQKVQREVVTLRVRSHGTVRPQTVTTLVAQVGGEILEVSSALAVGGFFQKDDLLVRVEATDYEIAVVQAKARLAQALQALALEEREAKLAIAEWKRVMGNVEPDPLAARTPQLETARANVAAAESGLEKARLDLGRTKILAPYAGRVSRKLVDVGQVLMPGQSLAVIHDTRRAELRLPLPDSQLAHLDLPPELGRGPDIRGPRVLLHAMFAGQRREWKGHVVRIEDEVDPRTRMVRLVVAIDDPYARRDETSHPPLPFGVFAAAEIEGKRRAGIVSLPREAMRGADTVYVLDETKRLRARHVEVMKTERDRVLVSGGLEEGGLVCLSPIETFVEGMPVRVAEDGSERDSR